MYADDEPPLRSELFGSDRMELHGRTLAGSHKLGPRGIRDPLLARLAENERVLTGACALLTSAVDANRRITPAGEWLLDNFYLIEEQIRTARKHLPKGYSRELPRLLDGPSAGLPRVYDIAHEAISHGDGRVDPESLSGFVASYQKVTVLTLGELWAIPIMLRLALIENLRRVGARVVAGSTARDLAAVWAEQMMEVAEKDPKSLILLTADMARSDPPMVSSFVAEFARRLQGQSTALALPLTWIEQRLSESGLTIEQLVRSENQQKAADQVSVSNSIGSLRFLAGNGLARIRRDDERRRPGAARGPRRSRTAGWISPPATATATPSRRSRRGAFCTRSMWRARRSCWPARARPGTGRTIARRMSGIT